MIRGDIYLSHIRWRDLEDAVHRLAPQGLSVRSKLLVSEVECGVKCPLSWLCGSVPIGETYPDEHLTRHNLRYCSTTYVDNTVCKEGI